MENNFEIEWNSDSQEVKKFAVRFSHIIRKPTLCICENNDTDQVHGYHEADHAFVFTTRILQPQYLLYQKFQASSCPLSLHTPACVGPCRKPKHEQKPQCCFSRVAAHLAFTESCSLYIFSEESSAFIAFLGSALSVALVLLFVPKYSKRAKAEGKVIQFVFLVFNSCKNCNNNNQRTIGPENAYLKPDLGVLSHHEMTLTLNTHLY